MSAIWTSLIPGLREVRAPLVAGYLWLLGVWLALEPCLPAQGEATGVVANFIDLEQAVSPVVTAIAISALAYFTGAVAEGILGRAWQGQLGFLFPPELSRPGREALREVAEGRAEAIASALAGSGGLRAAFANPPSRTDIPEIMKLLREAGRHVLGQVAGTTGVGPANERDAIAYATASLMDRISRDLMQVRTHLLAAESALHGLADRYGSEAELRFSVAAPLLLLVGVLTARWSAWWLFGVVAVLVLWLQGLNRRRRSGDVLAEALRQGKATTPMLERLDQERELLAAP